jgi:hypothetical protein
MERLTDPVLCRQVTDKYKRYFTFDVEDWLSKEGHYALIDGENIAFAEEKEAGQYFVHFCFHTARGREAIDLTKKMYKWLCENYPLKSAIGLIELDNKRARWLIRQVGFTSLGEVTTPLGRCEMFYKESVRGAQ